MRGCSPSLLSTDAIHLVKGWSCFAVEVFAPSPPPQRSTRPASHPSAHVHSNLNIGQGHTRGKGPGKNTADENLTRSNRLMFTIDVKTSTIYASIISPPTFNTILIRFDSFRQLIREKLRSF